MFVLVAYRPAPSQPDRTAAIQQAITDHATAHIQPLAGCWLVETDEALDIWTERFGGPGRLLVTRPGPLAGYLPTEMWEWINARV